MTTRFERFLGLKVSFRKTSPYFSIYQIELLCKGNKYEITKKHSGVEEGNLQESKNFREKKKSQKYRAKKSQDIIWLFLLFVAFCFFVHHMYIGGHQPQIIHICWEKHMTVYEDS